MAFTHGKKARVYANGFDLSAFLRRVNTAARIDVVDVSTLGDDAKEYIVGQHDATLHGEGLFEQDIAGNADKIDDVFAAAFGADAAAIFNVTPAGDTHGAPAHGFDAHTTSYEVASALAEAVSATVDAQSNVGREELKVHHVKQAEGATGQSASIDNAASSAFGGVGYIQVMGAGPIAAVTAKIQHSVDDSVWADLITFAAFTARTKERKTVTGTVNRYTRGQWSAGSTIPFWIGFGRYLR